MTNKLPGFFLMIILLSCSQKETTVGGSDTNPLTEFSDYYSEPVTEKLFSKNVADTFKLFKSIPKGYGDDSTKTFPVILILDANAFFESVVSELKFNSFIELIPKSIVIGVGYKDFMTMDSLRSRDYTYPTAIPEYEMSLSGGAGKFKKFIDEELLAKLTREYRIDLEKSVLCGHSLGGYFSLFYFLKSVEENRFHIKNIVSASPSFHYNHRYIFEMEKNLREATTEVPMRVYISMGSEDMADDESKGALDLFEIQILKRNYTGLKLKKAEYTNFGHIDAAVPGFIKGLTYVFEE